MLLCVGVCFAVCLLFLVVVCRVLLWSVGCCLWWCLLLFVVVVVVRVGGVVVGLDPLAPDPFWRTPPPPDPPPRDRPKFRAFFSLSRHQFRFFSLSLCVFSLNFGGFCEDRDPQLCTFGLSGCGVKPRRLCCRRGFTQQPENSKRAHLTPPALQAPPKNPRENAH